ncbi:MAG TPA: hypothetical protein VFA30_04950 [Gaiellaceae bacterium]|nr:hypothetical protein [Gaiellaceae bacterium]
MQSSRDSGYVRLYEDVFERRLTLVRAPLRVLPGGGAARTARRAQLRVLRGGRR